ncbi:MAG: hypothetical protein FJ086_00965 [Deltaproteobacteria bacterium]|nr:hypothetical protein [Deltaproteobacteria bacterium]
MAPRTPRSVPAADLAHAVQAHLAASGFDGEVTYQPSRDRVLARRPDGTTQFILLPSLAREWPQSARGVEKLLDRALLMLRPTPRLASEAVLSVRLLPRLFPREHFALAALRRQVVEAEEGEPAPELTLPSVPFNDSLSVGLVFEVGEDVSEVNEARLSSWGRDVAGLRALAVENLRKRTTRPLVRGRGGVFHAGENDGHDAARWLLPELLEGLKLKGEPVVMAPHVELLLVAGSEDDTALKAMGEMGLEASQQPQGLTGVAFKKDASGSWMPWMPEEGRACHEALRLSAIPALVGYAESQRELYASLGKELARTVVLEEAGRPRSAALWVRAEAPLLARAEYIVFALPGGEEGSEPIPVAVRPWEAVATLPGVRLTPHRMVPERFLAEGFPEPDALAKLT